MSVIYNQFKNCLSMGFAKALCLAPFNSLNDFLKYDMQSVSQILVIIKGWTGKDGSPSPTLGTIIKKIL